MHRVFARSATNLASTADAKAPIARSLIATATRRKRDSFSMAIYYGGGDETFYFSPLINTNRRFQKECASLAMRLESSWCNNSAAAIDSDSTEPKGPEAYARPRQPRTVRRRS